MWTTNLALHSYYKGQGFEHLRTLEFEDEWDYPSAVLFQKPTAAVNRASAARFEGGGELSGTVNPADGRSRRRDRQRSGASDAKARLVMGTWVVVVCLHGYPHLASGPALLRFPATWAPLTTLFTSIASGKYCMSHTLLD